MILRAGVIGLAEFLNSEFVPNFYPDPGGGWIDGGCLRGGEQTNSDQFTATLRVFQRLQGSLVTIFRNHHHHTQTLGSQEWEKLAKLGIADCSEMFRISTSLTPPR